MPRSAGKDVCRAVVVFGWRPLSPTPGGGTAPALLKPSCFGADLVWLAEFTAAFKHCLGV